MFLLQIHFQKERKEKKEKKNWRKNKPTPSRDAALSLDGLASSGYTVRRDGDNQTMLCKQREKGGELQVCVCVCVCMCVLVCDHASLCAYVKMHKGKVTGRQWCKGKKSGGAGAVEGGCKYQQPSASIVLCYISAHELSKPSHLIKAELTS